MTTYTWKIAQMYTVSALDTLYVVYAKWIATGTDSEHTASFSSGTDFSGPNTNENIIPYADLTEDMVLSWVMQELGTDGINSVKDNLNSQLNSLANPPLGPIDTSLPWEK